MHSIDTLVPATAEAGADAVRGLRSLQSIDVHCSNKKHSLCWLTGLAQLSHLTSAQIHGAEWVRRQPISCVDTWFTRNGKLLVHKAHLAAPEIFEQSGHAP